MPELFQYFDFHPLARTFVGIAFLALVAFAIFFVCRALLIDVILRATRSLSNIGMRSILDRAFLRQISWILPLMVLVTSISLVPGISDKTAVVFERLLLIALIFVGLKSVSILFSNFQTHYSQLEISKNRPIKGLLQVVMIVLYLTAGILIFSIVLDKSPWVFLSGLGAMTAILLLIFRDTILSFVAGVQLTANHLVRVGDWIEMPQFGADGDVIDIALNSVKVQNWDRTITVIPTHKFLENSFKNWRGMQESGGRRIKRSVLIDIGTIRFLNEKDIDKLKRFSLLKDYLQQKEEELALYNKDIHEKNLIVNARRLTNIGTLRAYLTSYLRQHARIRTDMTFLIRQLDPTSTGLPLEIYIFTNTVKWTEYETIQADIFDHIFAILPEFDLRAFQNPAGADFAQFGERAGVE